MARYTEYPIRDISLGLNKYHSLDNIPEGMMSELQNMDPLSSSQLVTRKGYEQFSGCLPLRASSFSKTDTTYKLEFDTSLTIDLSSAAQGPLIVAGEIPSDAGASFTGDFSDSFAAHYYSSYSLTLKETFSSGTPATKTKTAAQTGVTQDQIFVSIFSSDSANDNSNTLLIPEDIQITKSSYQIDVDYAAAANFDGFFTYLEVPDTTGIVHTESVSAQSSVTISSATHGLNNSNYIIRCYDDDGSTYTEHIPQTITANSSNGSVTVTFGSAFTGIIVMYAASNSSTQSAVAGSQTFSVTGVTSAFNFWELWITSGGTRTCVTPASISWTASTETASIDYVGPSAETVEIFWVPANALANSVEFEGTDGGVDFSTVSPEISVWGICHSGIYTSAATKGGFTHHLDNYKSESEDKMVTALGGNLMEETTYADGGSTYKMASLSLRGSNRVSGAQTLAPLFTDSADSRTRGDVYDASVNSDGYATITAVDYSGTSGQVDYTFTFTSKTGNVVLGTEVSTNDFLTVRNCGNDVHNGTFKIVSIVSDSSTSTVIRVENSSITSTDFDETGISAEGNVFTDQLLLTDTPDFIVGDKVSSSDTDDNTVKSVDVSASNYIYIDGITAATAISDGINVFVKRTSSVLPLQDFPSESVGDDTDGGFVIGDSVSVTGLDNIPKIKYVNTNTTQSVSVSIASSVATVTLTDHNLNVGQKVILKATSDSDFEGEFTIASKPSTSTFTVATTAGDGSPTATLVGKTIEIDESKELVAGPTSIVVQNQGRWAVVENPKSTAARVLETKTQHWDESDVTNQPYLRSIIVNDSMFLLNDIDEVKKYDGSNLTNAGIIPWQAGVFLSVDAGTNSLPAGPQTAAQTNPNSDGYFETNYKFVSIGQRFKSSGSGNIYTAQLVEADDAGKYRIYVDDPAGISGSDNSTPTLTQANTYRYYIRCNAIDINRNIIASASLGADDLYAETFTSSAIDIKIAGLPAFAEIDHDRIEIEVYRTKKNTAGPFYRVHRELVDYSDLGGYITWTDTKTDDQLTEAFLSISPIGSSDIGNQWSNPPSANAVTTADNRLILGNIKSPPVLDIAFVNNDLTGDLAVADFSGGEVLVQKSTAVSGSETFNDSIAFSFESSATTLTPASDISIADNDNSHTWVDGDVTTNQVAETGHNLYTGMKVRVSNSGGALPTGLAVDTTYYAIRVDANNYSFASSLANACAGTAISLTTGGGGTHTTDVYGDHIVVLDTTIGGLSAGEFVYLFHDSLGETNLLDFAGWYRITEADDATGSAERAIIDLKHNRSQGAADTNDVTRFVTSSSTNFDAQERVPVWIDTDGNLNQVFEDSSTVETKASSRLAAAINSVMSSDAPSNTYWDTTLDTRPAPWLSAQGGLSFSNGEMKIYAADNPNGTLNFQWSGLSADVKVFVNNVELAASTEASSEIRRFNSRIVVSYPNFPEIFDNPFADSGKSDSIIDVNPADGQAIRAIIPFFGQSAFNAANLAQAVVVFKTSSIYLVDVQSKQIRKIQSQGHGCTAPRSPAVAKDGIIFANDSGLYKLNWQMKVEWVGKYVDKLWKDELELDQIAEFCGHNYRQGQQYKLSTVTSGNTNPTNAVVYDNTREGASPTGGYMLGSWTEYTNHAATGWANQNKNAYFGNQAGQVMRIRNTGTLTDYRDDESAIADQLATTGGISYGLPGSRKTTSAVTLQYQNDSSLTDVDLSTEQSLNGTFNASTQVDISNENQTVKYALANRKGTYLRIKCQKADTKDEKLQISKIILHARDIGNHGVNEAANTS